MSPNSFYIVKSDDYKNNLCENFSDPLYSLHPGSNDHFLTFLRLYNFYVPVIYNNKAHIKYNTKLERKKFCTVTHSNYFKYHIHIYR